MKRIVGSVLFLVFSLTFVYAQKNAVSSGWIMGPSLTYQYQSKNFAKVSFWGLTDLSFGDYLKLDASANFTWHAKKTFVIPELGVTYFLNSLALWPYLKGELTPYTITPKVGASLFNVVDLGVGYGWSLQERKNLGNIEGFNISFGLSLPLNYFF